MPSFHLHRHLQSRLFNRRVCLFLSHQKDLHIENFIEGASVVVDVVVVDLVRLVWWRKMSRVKIISVLIHTID